MAKKEQFPELEINIFNNIMSTQDQELLDDSIKERAIKHQEHEHIRFKIVHQENTDTKTSEFFMQKHIHGNAAVYHRFSGK